MKHRIIDVRGREILDSRGNPTVEAEVVLQDGTVGRGRAPSGASTGEYEAVELRDGDSSRFGGKGTLRAVSSVNGALKTAVCGRNAADIYAVDEAMALADGTKDKSNLGANAVLAVSLACASAAAKSYGLPLYRFLGGAGGRLPVPMMNILNGGAHADNNIDVQEFMIMPVGARSFREGLRWCAEAYCSLRALLRSRGLSVSVGDEGGFAPDAGGDEEAIRIVLEAIERAGYTPGEDFVLAVDAAASEWKSGGRGEYRLPKSGKRYTSAELVAHWEALCEKYPLRSIEDGLGEEDWDGWRMMTQRLGKKVQLVGDDLFVTNAERLKKGIALGCANSVLVKPNQIGSVSETLEAVKTAQNAAYTAVASHRSGETEDTSIADLSVAFDMGQIKAGAPCRGERVAKYNRLLRIEEELGKGAAYAGRQAFRLRG